MNWQGTHVGEPSEPQSTSLLLQHFVGRPKASQKQARACHAVDEQKCLALQDTNSEPGWLLGVLN
jgi:hypothetical protein